MRFLLCICALSLKIVGGAWPPGTVNRHFFHTPKGLVHYVVRGDVKATPPLVFFHGHARSTEEMKTLAVDHIPQSQPFIAFDYFGLGHSDECICDETRDEFVTYNAFAAFALQVCDKLGVKQMIPFGALTGCSIAIELAGLAAEQGRVERMVLFEAFYLKPSAESYVNNIYIPSIRHLPIHADGSHLISAWFKPDGGPIGPSSSIPVASDLAENEQKTVDWLVALRTGWQFKKGWTAYNDKIIPRMVQLANASVKTLFIYGTYVDALSNKYGLDHDWSEAHINAVLPSSLRDIVLVNNGTEGSLHQNATLVAKYMHDFLGGWPASASPSLPVAFHV